MIPSKSSGVNNAQTLPENSIDLPLSPPSNMHPVTPPVHPNNSQSLNQSGEIIRIGDREAINRPHREQADDEQNGDQYSFLQFHVVDDDNATEEESEEGHIAQKLQARRPNGLGDTMTSKNTDGFTRRKSSQNSHISRGSGQNAKRASIKNNAMLNNYLAQNQMGNTPAMSTVIKQQQQGYDKMKTLTRSVLDQRKASKGYSGTRNPIKQRKPSGEPQQMNVHNQKGSRKNSQDMANRPPSQNSKNSGKMTQKPRVPFQNLSKSRENPMISLTGGGSKSSKKSGMFKKSNNEPQSASGLSETDLSTEHQPDNEYLETMKLRMRGLPDLQKSNTQTHDRHGHDNLDTQDIINRANHALSFKKSDTATNTLKDKYQSSAGRKGYSLRAMKRKEEAEKKVEQNNQFNADLPNKPTEPEENKKSPIAEDIDNCVQMIDEMFGGRDNYPQEQMNNTTIQEGQHAPSRKPKFLMSKLTNLMRDTKSSAQRNKYRAQVTNPFGQTISIVGPPQVFDEQYSTLQKSPTRGKHGSPKRRMNSPSNKSKTLKATQNFQGIVAFQKISPSKFDQIQESGNETEEIPEQQENIEDEEFIPTKMTPFQADIPVTDSPSQVTLEGISGMVVMDQKNDVGTSLEDEDDQKNDDSVIPYAELDIKKGESGGASSSSSSDRINNLQNKQYNLEGAEDDKLLAAAAQTMKQTLDLDSIIIDQQELHQISMSSREHQEQRRSKNNEFNSEIMSIIGSINLRAKELKLKVNKSSIKPQNDNDTSMDSEVDAQSNDVSLDRSNSLKSLDINRDCYSYPHNTQPAITNRTEQSKLLNDDNTEYDPLKAVALELSQDAIELDEQSINDNVSKKYSNLDQTIIIGEMEEGNIFDDLKISKESSEPNSSVVGTNISDLGKLKEKNHDENSITMTIDDLQDLVDNIKLKHRAEIDAIMTEQGTYKRIINELIIKLKQNHQKINQQDLKIINLQKFELQANKFDKLNQKLQSEVEFYRNQVDKMKIAMIEYDRHIHQDVIQANEFHIQQLETENAHLRKLLNIPDELFNKDPEEEKKREADKKRGMLKSIDEKLKAAEKKIARKQTAQDIYYQNHKKYGFDPFELDQEEYDMYRLSKLKEHQDMPKEMKGQLQNKIHNKLEDRHYQEEMRRHQEKEILHEFARVYGYDVNKHQPDPNGGEIDVEYLQAYIHECKMKEERMALQMEHEKSLAKQKEALKGKVSQVTKSKQGASSSNNSGTKSSAPAAKKQLTVETEPKIDSGSPAGPSSSSDATTKEDSNDNSDNSTHDKDQSSKEKDGDSKVKDPNDDQEPSKASFADSEKTESKNESPVLAISPKEQEDDIEKLVNQPPKSTAEPSSSTSSQLQEKDDKKEQNEGSAATSQTANSSDDSPVDEDHDEGATMAAKYDKDEGGASASTTSEPEKQQQDKETE